MADNKNNPTGKPQGDKREQPIKDLDKNVSSSKDDKVKGGAAAKKKAFE